MKIAATAYPLTSFKDWPSYEAHVTAWVADAAGQGADLLVFPEYGRMELATLDGPEVAGDLEESLSAAARRTDDADELTARLSADYGVHILAPSGPVFDNRPRPVNRSTLFAPAGRIGHQDKQVMTRFEREVWGVAPGGPLNAIDTELGRFGILICYDAEFPLLARSLVEQGAQVLLVPSCTEALSGYWRVRVGAMARALEGQCVVVHASTVGPAAWSPAVDQNTGAAAIYGPPDLGFPPTGVIAERPLNAPGWVVAEVDLSAVARVRAEGAVFNHAHWPESATRSKL